MQLAVAAAVVDVGAERGNLDDLAAVHHVSQAEAAADQSAVAEQGLDLFRGRVGGDVEILWVAANQQVADRAPDQMRGKTALAQPVQHAKGIGADVPARDVVLVARDGLQPEMDLGVGLHRAGVAAVHWESWEAIAEGNGAAYTSKPRCVESLRRVH